jgi:xanthine dehydrogenase/oxidase
MADVRTDVTTSPPVAPAAPITVVINGVETTITDLDPAAHLIDLLRSNDVGLTGTKLVCGEAGCGACTVLLSMPSPSGDTVWKAVNSCVHPVAQLDGASVTTIEHLGSVESGLHPIQAAVVAANGSQCGFCTPGFVMNMAGLLVDEPRPTPQQIEDHFDGNLCRCTGYRPILDAMHQFDDGAGAPTMPAPPRAIGAATPGFRCSARGRTWLRPVSLTELVQVVAACDPASTQLVGGNTSAGIYRAESAAATTLVDVTRVPELRQLTVSTTGITVGAGNTLADLMAFIDSLAGTQPPEALVGLNELRSHLDVVANVQVRNVATIGGNVMMTRRHVKSDEPFPSDVVLMLTVLGAQATIAQPAASGMTTSTVPIAALPDPLAAGYVLVAFDIPFATAGQLIRSFKLRRRVQNAHAFVISATLLTVSGNVVTSAAIVLGGISGWPLVCTNAAAALVGRQLGLDAILDTCTALTTDVEPAIVPMPSSGMTEDQRANFALTVILKSLVAIAVAVDPDLIPPQMRSTATPFVRPVSSGAVSFPTVPGEAPVGLPIPLLSAPAQTSGEARYTHDLPVPPRTLHAAFVYSGQPHASFDFSPLGGLSGLTETLQQRDPNVVGIVTVADIPPNGHRTMGFGDDEPIFADGVVTAYGMPIALALATTDRSAREAADLIMAKGIAYQPLSPVTLTIDEALALPDGAGIFHDVGYVTHISNITRPGSDQGWLANPVASGNEQMVTGTQSTGHQMHFYMETQSVLVVPGEPGTFEVHSSTQDPASAQAAVANVLGVATNTVTARVVRVGGGFGGKETRPGFFAAAAAVAARRFNRPVRLVLDRHTDACMMGGRHPYRGTYWVKFLPDGTITGWRTDFVSDGGATYDVTFPVSDLVLLSADGAYFTPTFGVNATCCRTNRATNTAMRTFGVIQCSTIQEAAIERVADELGMRPEDVRERNLYLDAEETSAQSTPYGQPLRYSVMRDVWSQLRASCSFDARASEIDAFNAANLWRKRGISMIPIKYGVSYTFLTGNQGGAFVTVNELDGTVIVATGGVEMGQGLATKLTQIAAETLGIDMSLIRVTETITDVIPNASSTGASTGSDLNGGAVKAACTELVTRLRDWCATNPSIGDGWKTDWAGAWCSVIKAAYFDRVNISAQALYASPDLSEISDQVTTGSPFYYFTYSAACSEVELDVLTGEVSVLRADILYDAGDSLNPALDIGQIRGGFVQGIGNVMCEYTYYEESGRPYTDGTWEYKIPDSKTIPIDFRVSLLTYDRSSRAQTDIAPDPHGIQSSKSTGEPPLVLASSVFFAIRRAIAAARLDTLVPGPFDLDSPATPERIHEACGYDFPITEAMLRREC